VSEVLNPVANRFTSGATLTHESAKAALAAGLQRIAAGAAGVDCAPLAQFDSAALAVLLAWVRAAAARGARFDIVNLPAGLASLAQAYGVDTLLPTQIVASARH
jgi:phospholipid transport system transporter-binding protein